jgi:HD-GYP domain-containing protein (c-di-GMP phosphodiesterase class II)
LASGNRTSASARAARRPRAAPRLWTVPVPSRAELAAAFAPALDLAEGRAPGHAARVCYIALDLAEALELPPDERRTVYYASLLHDAGAAPASAVFCRERGLTEERLFGAGAERSPQQLALEIAPAYGAGVVGVLRDHPEHGALVAAELGFGVEVQQAIAAHHERWDGHGYPRALKGEAVPRPARIAGAADVVESLISAEPNALTARRNLPAALLAQRGAFDPALEAPLRALTRGDAFWLGLHHVAQPGELPARCPEGGQECSPADIETFARVFAGLADAKGEHTGEHGNRTAEIALRLGRAVGLADEQLDLLRIAALVHDVGLLGVPARVIAKPDILSLSEMEMMRRHPAYSQMIVEALPGFDEMARWVGAHHERPDGKGYPELLDDDAIPLEARIIAVADTYVALTSPRPYRAALSEADAQQVLLGGAGTQLDPKLVQILVEVLAEPRSSRTAPRSRQRR